MYDLSLESVFLPDDEIIKQWGNITPSFQTCANEIFNFLCDTQRRHNSLMAHILKNLSKKDKKAIKNALAVDFEYSCIQMITRKEQIRKTSAGGRVNNFKLSNNETSLASFTRDMFFNRLYVIKDKRFGDEEFQEEPDTDEAVMAGFKYFLSNLPDKIKDLELNFIEDKYIEKENLKNITKLKETVRTYSFSPLNREFILYCYKYFSEIPSLKRSNKIDKNGNIVSFLNFDQDITAFKLSQSNTDDEENDDLLLLYDIEQHFMPYCMAILYEKMPNVPDKLLEDIKALAAPMTRLTLVKILAKYIEANKDTKIENTDYDSTIIYSYGPYESDKFIKIGFDSVADTMESFVSSFPYIFYYQYNCAFKNVIKVERSKEDIAKFEAAIGKSKAAIKKPEADMEKLKVDIAKFEAVIEKSKSDIEKFEAYIKEYKKMVNSKVRCSFGKLHKRLADKGYKEFYKKNYYKIMNASDQFYSKHRILLNNISEIDKKLGPLDTTCTNDI